MKHEILLNERPRSHKQTSAAHDRLIPRSTVCLGFPSTKPTYKSLQATEAERDEAAPDDGSKLVS